MVKILIGASLRQDQHVLEWYWRSLIKLKLPPDTTVEFCFVDDSDDQIDWMWWQHTDHLPTRLMSDSRPSDATYSVTHVTHEWQVATFEHLARQKQKIIQYAIDNGFDYFFMVDSDLLLDPRTLLSAISFEAPVVNSVFWTQWTPDSPPMPQVWLKNPYEMRGLGTEAHEFMKSLATRVPLRVIGGGACTLFDTRIFSHCRYYPRLEGLPNEGMWQGEDRTMSITCQQNHIEQYADPWPDVYHAYHPSMRDDETLREVYEHLQAPSKLFAEYGDLVSFELTAMDPTIAGTELATIQANLRDPRVKLIRGRIGGLLLAPEIESALMEMSPGQKRMIKIKFPHYIDLAGYPNQIKTMILRLHDIKEFGYAPILNESLMAGVL